MLQLLGLDESHLELHHNSKSKSDFSLPADRDFDHNSKSKSDFSLPADRDFGLFSSDSA